MVKSASIKAAAKKLKLRVMFQDEARFGRIQKPHRCWAQAGVRPLVGQQLVREYCYAYGSISPCDGKSDFLILPHMNQECFSVFLNEISARYPEDYVLMVCDGAACHGTKSIIVPSNISIAKLPPYSPELNPQENIWDDMREKWFKNKAFNSMDAVVDSLAEACLFYENDHDTCKSISSFPWIINNLMI